jgi:uncharacterized membrane protein
VLAIAITLLVLDLKVPAGNASLGHALTSAEQLSSYAAYVVSFLVLGITWVNHHSLFARTARVDRGLLFLNLALLLGLSVLPFPTAVLAHYLTAPAADAHAAAFLYSLVMLYVAVMFSAIWWRASADNGRALKQRLTDDQVRTTRRRFGLGWVAYLVTLGLSFVSAPLTLAVHGALAGYYAFEQIRG